MTSAGMGVRAWGAGSGLLRRCLRRLLGLRRCAEHGLLRRRVRRARDLVAALQAEGDALEHPVWRRRTAQMVVEELLHPHGDVLLIGALRGIVLVAVVVEKVDLLPEPAQRDEHLDPL